MASIFEKIPEAPPDAIFGLNIAFNADTHPNKLNLGVGAYRTEEGKPLVLNSVRKVSATLKLQEGFKGLNDNSRLKNTS